MCYGTPPFYVKQEVSREVRNGMEMASYVMPRLKILTFDITASILLKRRVRGNAELQEIDKGTRNGCASF
jgi:hypothetical protein